MDEIKSRVFFFFGKLSTPARPKLALAWAGARSLGWPSEEIVRLQGKPRLIDQPGLVSGRFEHPSLFSDTRAGPQRCSLASLQAAPAPCAATRRPAPFPAQRGVKRRGAALMRRTSGGGHSMHNVRRCSRWSGV